MLLDSSGGFVLDRWLGEVDLTYPFVVASIIGAAMLIVLMSLSWHHLIAPGEATWVRHTRRTGMALTVLCLWWSTAYAATTGWQPWPSHFGMVVALDFWVGISAVSAYIYEYKTRKARERAEATCWDPHNNLYC